jgi:hypothetical protein
MEIECTDQSWNQSGSPAPVRPDRTRPDEKFIRPDETGFFSIFLPDFCRIFVSLTSKMNRTDLPDFFRFFCPIVCEISAGFLSV